MLRRHTWESQKKKLSQFVGGKGIKRSRNRYRSNRSDLIILNSAVKEDENGADARKHKGF
jgi:hypothetical protein